MPIDFLGMGKGAGASHLITGRRGEDIAADHLQKLGYEVRARNIRLGRDEIDILAFDPADEVIVFAEVKTRSRDNEDFRPELNAGYRKCEKLKRSARRWVAENNYESGYRLDLICVVEGRVVNHFKELAWE